MSRWIQRIVQKKGNVPEKDIYRTLNMGIGMVVIVRPDTSQKACKLLKGSRVIGFVEKGPMKVELI